MGNPHRESISMIHGHGRAYNQAASPPALLLLGALLLAVTLTPEALGQPAPTQYDVQAVYLFDSPSSFVGRQDRSTRRSRFA